MIQICKKDKEKVFEAIHTGQIDAAEMSFPNLIDDMILTMKQRGLTDLLAQALPDKRRDNKHIPLGILLCLAVAAKLKCRTSLTDVPFAVTEAELLSDTAVTCKDIVSDIIGGRPVSDNPEAALQTLFTLLAVLPSVQLGLIDAKNLTLSGDGTAVVSHASPYGRHLSSCSKTCPYWDGCARHYSDPDAAWGRDSDNKTWFFGHTLYMLCSRNNSLKIELPLLIKFIGTRRHDSKNFLYAIDDFGRHLCGLSLKNVCLDSAHDNIPTYELLERWDINALIDINGRVKSSPNAPKDITFDKAGHPLCPAGHKMCPWGNDPIKDAHKYRCPLKCGRIDSCSHAEQCSPGNYGRTVYIKNHGDLRFHPRIPRDSEEYRQIYSERTACERVNDRVLNDYCLQHLKIRGKDHFSFWGMLIGICIHLDARYKAAHLYIA